MPYWICCNSCFQAPGPDRKVAVTTCGHIICSVCFQKGKQGECLLCKAKCQVSPLSDKSCAEVKALFSDIDTVATKYFTEISKVLFFQARHQRRLMAHYQQRIEKLEEVLLTRKQEMQQMSKKLAEQSAYIAKLENTLQHQSAKVPISTQPKNQRSYNTCGLKSVLQIPYSSPISLSRQSSSSNLVENMEVDQRSLLFRKPEVCGSVPRLSLISPPQDGHIGTVGYRSASQKTLVNRSACSATVRASGWDTPMFKPMSAFQYSSLSSLVTPTHGKP